MANASEFGVHSEVGQLRKVMVCSPGRAHQRLTPSNCDQLLFDDVLWVEVADETDALVRLAARGIIAGAGSKSYVERPPHDLIRLSAMQLPETDTDAFDRLAAAVAEAARGGREFFD